MSTENPPTPIPPSTEITLEQFKQIVIDAVERFQGKFTPDPDTEEPVTSSDFVYKNFNEKIDVLKLKVASMKDFPDQFKIVTDKNKNVIVEIKTQKKADALLKYIQKYKSLPTSTTTPPPPDPTCPEGEVYDKVQKKCIPKPPEPEPCPEGQVRDPVTGLCKDKPIDPDPQPTTGDKDKFGVKMMHPMTGRIFYDWVKNPNAGIRHDFKGKPSDMVNIELTGYFSMPNPPDDEVSGKFSNDRHSDGTQPHTYDMGVDNHTGETRIRYENPHPVYTGTLATGEKGVALGPKFIGYKFTRIDVADGNVMCEIFQDAGNNEGDTPANNWKKLFSWTDTKYKIHSYPKGVEATLRLDGDGIEQNLKQKWLSMAEVKSPTSTTS